MKIEVHFHQDKNVPPREVEAEEISVGGLRFHVHELWPRSKDEGFKPGRWAAIRDGRMAISRRGYYVSQFDSKKQTAAEYIREQIRGKCSTNGKVDVEKVVDLFLTHWKAWECCGVDKLFLMQEEGHIRKNIKVAG